MPSRELIADSVETIFTNIVNPIMGLVDKVTQAPLDTIISILPGLVHFLSIKLKPILENDLVINANPITLGLYLKYAYAIIIDVRNKDLTTNAKVELASIFGKK